MLWAYHHPGSELGTEPKGIVSAAVGRIRIEGSNRAGTTPVGNISAPPFCVAGLVQAVVDNPLVTVSRNDASMASKEEG